MDDHTPSAYGQNMRVGVGLTMLGMVAVVGCGNTETKTVVETVSQTVTVPASPDPAAIEQERRNVQEAQAAMRTARTQERRASAQVTRNERKLRSLRRQVRSAQRDLETILESVPDDDGSSDGECHEDYEGACLDPDTIDVDCTEIPEQDFESVGLDPFDLDRDSDGVACES